MPTAAKVPPTAPLLEKKVDVLLPSPLPLSWPLIGRDDVLVIVTGVWPASVDTTCVTTTGSKDVLRKLIGYKERGQQRTPRGFTCVYNATHTPVAPAVEPAAAA